MSQKKKQETLFTFVNSVGAKSFVNLKTLLDHKNIGYLTKMYTALTVYKTMTDKDGDLIIPSYNISNPHRIDFEIDEGVITESGIFSGIISSNFGSIATIKEDLKIRKVVVRIKLGTISKKPKGDSK